MVANGDQFDDVESGIRRGEISSPLSRVPDRLRERIHELADETSSDFLSNQTNPATP
jgi:hypothetical protein